MKTRNNASNCAHAGCDCELGKNSIQIGDGDYCSQGCADGEGCNHPGCNCSENQAKTSDDSMQGEGNRAADRRYREGVRKTVESTTESERAKAARGEQTLD
jgi:hypothetical protein